MIRLDLNGPTVLHFPPKALVASRHPWLDDLGKPIFSPPPLDALGNWIQVEEPVLHRVSCDERESRSSYESVLLRVQGHIPQQHSSDVSSELEERTMADSSASDQ